MRVALHKTLRRKLDVLPELLLENLQLKARETRLALVVRHGHRHQAVREAIPSLRRWHWSPVRLGNRKSLRRYVVLVEAGLVRSCYLEEEVTA